MKIFLFLLIHKLYNIIVMDLQTKLNHIIIIIFIIGCITCLYFAYIGCRKIYDSVIKRNNNDVSEINTDVNI